MSPAIAATAFTARTSRCAWPAKARAKGRSISSWRYSPGGAGSFPRDQRTIALVQRTERLLRRNARHDLEIVPVPFRLLGRFHLQQVHRVDFAAVLPDSSFAEKRIVGSRRFHGRDYRFAVARAARLVDRLEEMQHRRIDPGLHVVRHRAVVSALAEALRPRARALVHVPVERVHGERSLRSLEPQRGYVVDAEN